MEKLISLLEEMLNDQDYSKVTLSTHVSSQGEECRDSEYICTQSEKYFIEFAEIYKDLKRHSYYKISKFIEGTIADNIVVLREEIENIILFAKESKWDEDTTCKLEKLLDHISLESVRIDRIAALKLSVDNNKIEKEEADKLLKKANNTFSDIENKHKNLSGQLIAILGIFAGIVISFAIAASTIGEALANLSQNNLHQIIIVILMLGIVFINAIIAMLYFIAKLSGHLNQGKTAYVIWIVLNVVLISLFIYLYVVKSPY